MLKEREPTEEEVKEGTEKMDAFKNKVSDLAREYEISAYALVSSNEVTIGVTKEGKVAEVIGLATILKRDCIDAMENQSRL